MTSEDVLRAELTELLAEAEQNGLLVVSVKGLRQLLKDLPEPPEARRLGEPSE